MENGVTYVSAHPGWVKTPGVDAVRTLLLFSFLVVLSRLSCPSHFSSLSCLSCLSGLCRSCSSCLVDCLIRVRSTCPVYDFLHTLILNISDEHNRIAPLSLVGLRGQPEVPRAAAQPRRGVRRHQLAAVPAGGGD
jgi:hypothetical protein